MLGRSLEARDEALAAKEKEIAALRMDGHTLDNYKYVLDHRVENMAAERGPIIKHVANLESHIDDMYAEMVSEFEDKKVSTFLQECAQFERITVLKKLSEAVHRARSRECG